MALPKLYFSFCSAKWKFPSVISYVPHRAAPACFPVASIEIGLSALPSYNASMPKSKSTASTSGDSGGEIQAARNAPLFAGITEPELAVLVGEARKIRFARTAILFRQGRPADHQFLLLRGRVKISQVSPEGQDVILRFISPGEIFAIASTLGSPEYPATAEAVEDSIVLCWNGSAMLRLMERFPRIARNTIPILSARIRELQDRLRELMTERVERRIARAVLRLARQAGRGTQDGTLIDMTVTRQTLAELAGTTLFTASRTLSTWEKDGIVTCGRRRITLRDEARLQELAEDL